MPFLVPALLLASVPQALNIPGPDAEYHRLAERGSKPAQIIAAYTALIAGDSGEAFRWFRAAAESGDSDSQCKLADLYLNGRGTVRDAGRAAHWYALSASTSVEALWKLGRLFEEGDGVTRKPEIAASLFLKAAQRGLPDAQNSLATMYEAGIGVKRDVKEALRWYRKAAAQNCADAQLNLAALYLNGIGVDQNLAEARVWALRARAARPQEADQLLSKIEEAGRASPQ